ncbi:uncharacterized protein EI97DRAFT_484725 [Westerdykella ornata]|uniref:Uncharacterized protein n=1 Tax=Westerdykella ornata TaxID=318751 RepID=A0A6A6JRT6_WESOR|nr:uncharacterized protein EI97DRAFT_484725 [Westerdykella ornata]KAF2278965.1 hypothetical protein EI97DRAFT_484725 [Westerdykella ornata]
MAPSYPSFEWVSQLSVRFKVPNKQLVYKILEDCDQDERLQVKAAGTLLYYRIKRLAALLSRHRIQLNDSTPLEADVTLFLPPSPCPPPKPTTVRPRGYSTSLATIPEENERPSGQQPAWIEHYEYMPAERRYGMCVNPRYTLDELQIGLPMCG